MGNCSNYYCDRFVVAFHIFPISASRDDHDQLIIMIFRQRGTSKEKTIHGQTIYKQNRNRSIAVTTDEVCSCACVCVCLYLQLEVRTACNPSRWQPLSANALGRNKSKTRRDAPQQLRFVNTEREIRKDLLQVWQLSAASLRYISFSIECSRTNAQRILSGLAQ